MSTNKKVLLIVSLLLGALALVTIINVSINFYTFGQKRAIEKAHSVAESVRDGLTSHMVNGTMQQRFMFLHNMVKHQTVENLRTLRAKSVIEQFGKGKVDVYEYDDIEKKVMLLGKSISKSHTSNGNEKMRVTIPYTASKYSSPNCLECHTNVQEGDVLGVISMDVDIEDVYQESVKIIIRIVAVTFIFLLISIYIANRYIRPYINLFDDLEEGISKAYRGDFTHHVTTKLSNEAGKVANRLNELSEIFRFKKTIELDEDAQTIYSRLARVLNSSLDIHKFVFMEVDINKKEKTVVYKSNDEFEDGVNHKKSLDCRAYRTSSVVTSSDFDGICEVCCSSCKFICMPFAISEGKELVLHIEVDSTNELVRIRDIMPIINNYFELAKPVLESKILLDILHKTTLIDPMTGLYNRRFLDQFIDTISPTKQFSVLMLDIDFFKAVNDTYGHHVGDTVIKGMAEVLKKEIKGSDMAIRYGGEEFVVVLFDLSEEISIRIAESIRNEFSLTHFESSGTSFNKTLSVGVSLYPGHNKDAWQVIKYADQALYEAKKTGRDKVVLYNPALKDIVK